jgi:hypothetical protein
MKAKGRRPNPTIAPRRKGRDRKKDAKAMTVSAKTQNGKEARKNCESH